jgi:hypothetical protein
LVKRARIGKVRGEASVVGACPLFGGNLLGLLLFWTELLFSAALLAVARLLLRAGLTSYARRGDAGRPIR